MTPLPLSRNQFAAWLDAHPPAAVVGSAQDAHGDPLARALATHDPTSRWLVTPGWAVRTDTEGTETRHDLPA